MRKIAILVLTLLLLNAFVPILVAATPRNSVSVIVMFKQKADVNLIRSMGGKLKTVYKFKPALAARIPEYAIEHLKKNPQIIYIFMICL